jgi:type VI secretion system lysozyme-like protein
MALLLKLAGKDRLRTAYDIESIIDNLDNILNSVRNYDSFLSNFGMSDYRYLSGKEDIARAIIEEIKNNIKLYEPRIRVQEVTFIQEIGFSHLSFNIDAVLSDNGKPLKLFLNPVNKHFQVIQ